MNRLYGLKHRVMKLYHDKCGSSQLDFCKRKLFHFLFFWVEFRVMRDWLFVHENVRKDHAKKIKIFEKKKVHAVQVTEKKIILNESNDNLYKR